MTRRGVLGSFGANAISALSMRARRSAPLVEKRRAVSFFGGEASGSFSVTSSRISSPVRFVGEQHPDAITASPARRRTGGQKTARPKDSNALSSSGSARNTSSGMGFPVGPSTATMSKQNDFLAGSSND